jgi:hypothetical protein
MRGAFPDVARLRRAHPGYGPRSPHERSDMRDRPSPDVAAPAARSSGLLARLSAPVRTVSPVTPGVAPEPRPIAPIRAEISEPRAVIEAGRRATRTPPAAPRTASPYRRTRNRRRHDCNCGGRRNGSGRRRSRNGGRRKLGFRRSRRIQIRRGSGAQTRAGRKHGGGNRSKQNAFAHETLQILQWLFSPPGRS